MEEQEQALCDIVDEFLREELPKQKLTEEQFNRVVSLNRPDAIKYLISIGFGSKEAACYFDLYEKETHHQI